MISKTTYGFFFLLVLLLAACSSNDDVERFLQAEEVSGKDLVSLKTSANSLLVNPGESVQFSVKGVKENGEEIDLADSVEWRSTDPTVAMVDSSGLVIAKADGSTRIEARLAHLQAGLRFEVNSASLVAIKLEAEKTDIEECQSIDLTLSGQFSDGSNRLISGAVTWSSSDQSLASVASAAEGARVNTHEGGAITISAEAQGVSGSIDLAILDGLTSIVVTPRELSVSVGASQQVKATGTWSNADVGDITEATAWNLTDSGVGHFDDDISGLLTADAIGDATIIATCGGERTEVPLEVLQNTIDRVEINANANKITLDTNEDGYQLFLRSIGVDGSVIDVTEDAEWSRISPADDTIQVSNDDDSKGELTITGTGTANIEASYEGFSDTILIVVE